MPRDPETHEPWKLSDRERLLLIEKELKNLWRDQSTLVLAVEGIQRVVRELEDYKLTLTTQIQTIVGAAKTALAWIGVGITAANILIQVVFKYVLK